jgi:hypothetical protein
VDSDFFKHTEMSKRRLTIVVVGSMLASPAAAESLARNQELRRLIQSSCANPVYLDCMKSDHSACSAQLPIISEPCVKISFIASTADSMPHQVRRALLKCIITAHADFAGISAVAVTQCIAGAPK